MQLPPNMSRLLYAAVSLVLVWGFALTYRDAIYDNVRGHSTPTVPVHHAPDANASTPRNAAVIIDTQYTPRLLPLILHYQAVLGRSWPIIFYTSQETYDLHLAPTAANVSAVFQRAVAEGGVEVRLIHEKFDLTQREGVNVFLSDRWMWEELAPAEKVLVFQADSMMCANAHRTVDDFLQWDFIGAIFHKSRKVYNGGLSLRNRQMMLDILDEGRNWEEETKSGKWDKGGEDVWFSHLMGERGANLPPAEEALDFSLEFNWQINEQKAPLGYHKVHKNAAKRIAEIREWCPEIDLAAAGILAPST